MVPLNLANIFLYCILLPVSHQFEHARYVVLEICFSFLAQPAQLRNRILIILCRFLATCFNLLQPRIHVSQRQKIFGYALPFYSSTGHLTFCLCAPGLSPSCSPVL